ncbi:Uncharacterised protein [Yersinia kristensenii]|nr:Uncharacterised protein [Yersinia kristensenii]
MSGDFTGFHEDDIAGQCRHLLGTEVGTEGNIERLAVLKPRRKQLLELLLGAAVITGDRLTGQCQHLVAHQTLFIGIIPQTFEYHIGVVIELLEHIVRAAPVIQIGKCRVGFDQIAAAHRTIRGGEARSVHIGGWVIDSLKREFPVRIRRVLTLVSVELI